MKTKKKILFSNILIAILVACAFIHAGVLCLKNKFAFEKNSDVATVEALSDVNVNKIKKTGLLDLFNKEMDFTPRPQIKITNKKEFSEFFNAYFINTQEETGYEMKARTNLVATADVLGGISAYQIIDDYYKIDTAGNSILTSMSCEVPSPSGKTTGYGVGLGLEQVFKDGYLTTKETENVTYKEEGGNYTLVANYDNCKTTQNEAERISTNAPFLFVVDEKTIDTIAIKENTLSYIITVRLNFEGYKEIAKDIEESSEAESLPKYEYFELEVLMNKYGEVVSFSRREKFSVNVKRLGLNVNANTVCSGIYSITKLKNDD